MDLKRAPFKNDVFTRCYALLLLELCTNPREVTSTHILKRKRYGYTIMFIYTGIRPRQTCILSGVYAVTIIVETST